MELDSDASGRGKLARVLLAGVLAVVSIWSLRSGKRARGVLAGVGALALGYVATSDSPERAEVPDFDDSTAAEPAEPTDADATDEDAKLRCAVCGEPIRVGQSRGPNEDDEIVHDACE